jgi:hypothetical protein
MARNLKPRAPVVVSAASVSQLTCLALLGVDPRRFLDVLIPRCSNVAKLGRLRLVPLEDAVEGLRTLAVDDSESADEAVEPSEGQPESADEVLAALGMERA